MASSNSQSDLLALQKSLYATDMAIPLDQDSITQVLSSAPFITLPGGLNLRSCPVPVSTTSGSTARPLLYRCGGLNALAPTALNTLPRPIGLIVDLRGLSERKRAPEPTFEDEDRGIIAVEQLTEQEDESVRTKTEELMRNVMDPNFQGTLPPLEESYTDVLTAHSGVFGRVVTWIAGQSQKSEKEREGVLFHCTAGKDRTAVLAALLCSLTGIHDADIIHDYALSRIGVEAQRERLTAQFQVMLGQMVGQSKVGDRNSSTAAKEKYYKQLSSCQAESMEKFLKLVEERWGGFEKFSISEEGLGLDKEVVESAVKVLKME